DRGPRRGRFSPTSIARRLPDLELRAERAALLLRAGADLPAVGGQDEQAPGTAPGERRDALGVDGSPTDRDPRLRHGSLPRGQGGSRAASGVPPGQGDGRHGGDRGRSAHHVLVVDLEQAVVLVDRTLQGLRRRGDVRPQVATFWAISRSTWRNYSGMNSAGPA